MLYEMHDRQISALKTGSYPASVQYSYIIFNPLKKYKHIDVLADDKPWLI